MSRKSKARQLETAAKSQHPQLFQRRRAQPVQAAVMTSAHGDGSIVLTPAQRWVRWLAPLLVALLTLAAFLPTLQNQFVRWDDPENFLDNPDYPGLACLLFAVHPLRVESVAWFTERRDVLSGLFYLLTILVYLRACERETHGRGWYWLSVVVFGGALLSKSMAVSLPVVLLILDVY